MASFDGDRSPSFISPGLGSVGSYQMSGIPFASSSIGCAISSSTPARVCFPFVTKNVVVRNDSASVRIRVGFSSLGVRGLSNTGSLVPYVPVYGAPNYYFTLASNESFSGDWRLEDIYLLSDDGVTVGTASVIASLTPIPRGVPPMTGNIYSASNWSGSFGVG